jgi:nucleoside-diphosphate-sugar epimerase
MSIAITGAAGQLGRLVIDDLLSAGIPGTDLIAIARPRPEIGHLDETDRCGHRMRRVYCRSTTRCERTQMLRSYINNKKMKILSESLRTQFVEPR